MRTTLKDCIYSLLARAYRDGLDNPVRHTYGQYEPDDAFFWELIEKNLPAHAVEELRAAPWETRRTLIAAARAARYAGQTIHPVAGEDHFVRQIPGTTWVLKHTSRAWTGGSVWTDVQLYADPRTAIADLAAHVRQNWALKRQRVAEARPTMPETPPTDDAAAVALYYWHMLPEREPGHDTFDLTVQAINPIRHAETLAGWALVIGGDVQCPCGNEASSSGFEYAERSGQITGPERGSCDFLVCLGCFRHIEAATGRVLGQLDRDAVAAGLDALEAQRSA